MAKGGNSNHPDGGNDAVSGGSLQSLQTAKRNQLLVLELTEAMQHKVHPLKLAVVRRRVLNRFLSRTRGKG